MSQEKIPLIPKNYIHHVIPMSTNRSREAQVVEDGHVARGNAIEEWHLLGPWVPSGHRGTKKRCRYPTGFLKKKLLNMAIYSEFTH